MVLKKLLARLQGKDRHVADERRKFARLVYPSGNRPVLKVKDDGMQVVDISEKGIKFLKDKQTKISECVHGTAELLNGRSLEITGKIIWERENEVGLLITRIPESTIVEEIRTLLRELGTDATDNND